MFWQPVYQGEDLPAGTAIPLKIMGEQFTLYRGRSGNVYLVDFRCAHRGTQLSVGWVEEDSIRCFYHGWKYDGRGRCVEQPAEPAPFCEKIRIPSFPVKEYLGLIFAYLGDREPPSFPQYPEFEQFDGLLELDSYARACNYFNNLENSLDSTHVGFVHRAHGSAFDGAVDSPVVAAEESAWGVTFRASRPSGAVRVTQFGMPNIFHMHALPRDGEVGWREFLCWWVPIDNESHFQLGVTRLPISGEAAERYLQRRKQRKAAMYLSHSGLAEKILAGRLRLDQVDAAETDIVRLQDDIAQIGQGRIVDRERERLGRADAGVIMIRKLWARELQALADGRPLKEWRRPEGLRPMNWRSEAGEGREK
jgi:5,5'-dehydrodivanillate O-demethylase